MLTELDPRLQRLVEKGQRGFRPRATSSTQTGQVAVVARVRDVDAWWAHPDVNPGVLLGSRDTGGERGYLCTARVPLQRIEHLRGLDNVLSLKAAQPIRPAIHETVRDIRARRDLLPKGLKSNQGSGTLIGVVDFGCDFTHRDLRNADGSTRLIGIWDQRADSLPDSPLGYGQFHNRKNIDSALRRKEPFAALGYRPDQNLDWKSGAHGTHVLGIAAGNGKGSGSKYAGIAPKADLLFVELSASDIPWEGDGVTTSSFGDSVQLLEAVQFIFDTAGGRPCVVNLSLGTNGGPHDGSTLVEEGIDQIVSAAPNRAVVIAASNSHEDHIHTAGQVRQAESFDIRWDVRNTHKSHKELELWYTGSDEFEVELLMPDGTSLGRVALGDTRRSLDDTGELAFFVAHRRKDPNNGDNAIGILLEVGVPQGIYIVRLHGVRVQNGQFHAWIERDDGAQSRFKDPVPTHTLGSISCGEKSITVGSYDAHKAHLPLSSFSSAGPIRQASLKKRKLEKPELSAPGQAVWSVKSGSQKGLRTMSGTSMAAPAVSGAVALLYAEAHARGLSLPVDELRQLLLETARPEQQGWHPRLGFGRLDVAAALKALQARVPVTSSAKKAPRVGSKGLRGKRRSSARPTKRKKAT
ncbi:S8 family peptidase [Myxococcus sp. RHSTA-1-4]|uniref:S8 family peptidase n=1 Tax=Myxococcus sp. RHSTA-1-4 TaxID=2874601 RepID=UPI001CBF7A59|nr:S8 family peptidase [Myxococcus sp. RHSTA-1-4]